MDYAQIRADLDEAIRGVEIAQYRWHNAFQQGRATAYRHARLPELHALLQHAATELTEYETQMDVQSWASTLKIGDYLASVAKEVAGKLAEVGLEPSQPDTATAPRSAGQIGYDAYGNHAGWTTFDGRPMPVWHDLGERVQRAWQAAADAITADHDGGNV